MSKINSYNACIYARLSRDDGDKLESDSIINQKALIRDFLSKHPEIHAVSEKTDDGYSGVNFDRPAFQEMMDDIRSGKINCVVVKDLSRFGRNYIEAGQYLEKIFPFLGVKFISITDGYDSLTSDDAEGALMIPLKNMMNDVYAKDISRKIITSFRARQEKGEYLPAFPPYGYVKSKTRAYRYEVDEEVAPYVRMIFEWKAAGVSHNEICKRLNDMGAVTPAKRKVELGIWHAEKYKHTVWYGRTIIDILKNITYTGTLVYGKMPKSLYQGIKCHRAKPEEWRTIPDAHEAIISRELYDKVQEMFEARAKDMQERMDKHAPLREQITNHFRGKIYCGDCGKRMRFVKANNRHIPMDQEHSYYVCGGYIDSGYRNCTRRMIRYPDVETAVMAVIQGQVTAALDQEKLLRQMRGSVKEKSLIDKYVGQINYISQELKKVNGRREHLFESFTEGVLDEAEYRFAKQKYDDEAAELGKKLSEAKARKKQLDEVLTLDNKWLAAMRETEEKTVVDSELVKHLIKAVKIYEDKRVEVELNFGEQKQTMKRIIGEMMGEDSDE